MLLTVKNLHVRLIWTSIGGVRRLYVLTRVPAKLSGPLNEATFRDSLILIYAAPLAASNRDHDTNHNSAALDPI